MRGCRRCDELEGAPRETVKPESQTSEYRGRVMDLWEIFLKSGMLWCSVGRG